MPSENIVHTVNRRKGNWIGHVLRRKCLLKHVIVGKIEGRIEVMGRRGRRCKQLLYNIKQKMGYCILKEGVLCRILWGISLGRGCGSVVRLRCELTLIVLTW